jgi:Rad3-related DNA helicase
MMLLPGSITHEQIFGEFEHLSIVGGTMEVSAMYKAVKEV